MQTVAYLEKYAKQLVSVNSSASLGKIQTIMLAKKVSHIPIINTNHGQFTNSKVVRRKTIWSWMYRNGGATPTLTDVLEDPLPVVNRDNSLVSAMNELDRGSAVLIRGESGAFTHFLSPRVVAKALRDYSEKFQVIEQLEEAIRSRLSSVSGEDLAIAVQFESKELGDSGEVKKIGSKLPSVDKLNFAEYQLAFGRLWPEMGLTSLDRKFVLRLMETVRVYRNEVMHFRLQGNEEGLAAVNELLGLLNADLGK